MPRNHALNAVWQPCMCVHGVCVCMCVCVCTCECRCACPCARVQSQRRMSGVFSLSFFLETGSLAEPRVPPFFSYTGHQQTLTVLLSLWSHLLTTELGFGVLGIRVKAFMFAQKALLVPELSPQSLQMFLMKPWVWGWRNAVVDKTLTA